MNFTLRNHGFLIVLLLAPSAALAQDTPPKFELFAEGGSSTVNNKSNVQDVIVSVNPTVVLASTVTSHLSPTGRLFVGARFFFRPSEAVEFSYSYAPTDFTITVVEPTFPTPTVMRGRPASVDEHMFSLNYVRAFRTNARLRPFFTFGVGGVYWKLISFNSPGFAGNFGGGLDYSLSSHWSVRTEYRDFLLEYPQGSAGGPTGLSHNQMAAAGFVFRF
ncbi:MAG: outer membrane protein [Candidatus Acidiferrales bacterium]